MNLDLLRICMEVCDMEKRQVSSVELYNDLVHVIRDKIEEQIDNEYTSFKIQCLDNLEYTLEKRRNETVKSILDSIDIVYRNDMHLENNVIEIKIVKE